MRMRQISTTQGYIILKYSRFIRTRNCIHMCSSNACVRIRIYPVYFLSIINIISKKELLLNGSITLFIICNTIIVIMVLFFKKRKSRKALDYKAKTRSKMGGLADWVPRCTIIVYQCSRVILRGKSH